jgi:hypothetical protein
MAYDYLDGYVIYFGGYTGSGYIANTWEYSGGCWLSLGPLAGPDPRSEFGMVWDGADNYVLLFGGADDGLHQCNSANSKYFYMCGDTWDFVAGAWHIICNNNDSGVGGSACGVTPPNMNSPMMAYDPVNADCNGHGVAGATNGCVFLFGGLYCISSCGAVGEVDGDSSTLWEFFGGTWYKSTLTGPPARDFGQMTYDSNDAYVLLYGGEVTACTSGSCTYTTNTGCVKDSAMSVFCDDAWSLSGQAWTAQCQGVADEKGNTVGACLMPGRVGNAMAYDGFQKYVVDYGGFDGKTGAAGYDTDSFGYCYGAYKWVAAGGGGGDWQAISNPGASITRYGASMVYDPGSQDSYIIVFGGVNNAAYYNTMYGYK